MELYCTFCGGLQPANNAFCVYCGRKPDQTVFPKVLFGFQDAELITNCPQCGQPISADDAFCASCGAKCPEEMNHRKPLCICCGQMLVSSASFCGNCGASYQLDENGYLDIPQERTCSCGAVLMDTDRFCPSCGNPVSSEIEYKKAVLLCTNCHKPLRSLNKYCASCGTNWRESVRPKIDENGLTCPVCGADKMPLSRKVCWQCGAKFSLSPWQCHLCGQIALYEFPYCPSCKMRNFGNQLVPPEFVP